MPAILWPVQPRTNRTFGIIDAVTFTTKNNPPKVTIRLQPFLCPLSFGAPAKESGARSIPDCRLYMGMKANLMDKGYQVVGQSQAAVSVQLLQDYFYLLRVSIPF
jgi:hypothetical protein